MKKNSFTGSLPFLILLLTISWIHVDLKAQNKIAEEQCRKMGRGVNIIGYDKALWKDHTQGRFKETYFRMIREAGFSTVRVNLYPFSAMDASLTINSKWFETLDWVVKKGLEAKLIVILDMHEYEALGEDPEANEGKYLAAWKQLASRYKDQPNDILFEVLNEPNQKLTDELWNKFLLDAHKIIRETNPNRTLIIGPGHWNSIESLHNLILPNDDRNIIVTVHFYQPMRFTHQGAPWNAENKNLSGIKWMGSPEDKDTIDRKFEVVANWSRKNDRPIFLGEFGAYDKGDMDSRARYTSCVARTAEKYGFSWAYWQFDSDFIVYNIDNETWVYPILNALMDKK